MAMSGAQHILSGDMVESWGHIGSGWRVHLGAALVLAIGLFAAPAVAQTPSPLANWQYAAGEVLAPLGGPLPDWRISLGGGVDLQPLYDGAKRYRLLPSVVVDVRYKDIAFLSDGEGLGVNLLRGRTYRAGVALSYDLGRNHHLQHRLNDLGNIAAAPEAKLFAEYFIKPVVLTADLRKGIGGHNGVIGDLGAYVPVEIAEGFYVFTGPSVTLADGRYMQAYFGVSPAQASGSPFHVFTARGGLNRAGWGLTVAYQWTEHWWLEAEGAWQYLLGDAAASPITETKSEFAAGANLIYRF